MFDYIKGIITRVDANYVVLESNNIGYQIKTPNPFIYKLHEERIIYIHTYLRENIFDLYGFKSIKERSLFLNLISVKGLGPKTALAILASSEPEEVIQAINEQNVMFLQKFPGIGPKVSHQIILDLMGKLVPTTNAIDPKLETVYEALKSLGYQNREINQIHQELQDNKDLPIEDLIKLALRKLKVFK
ncbi:MAG: Holliday junction branch migration protein RuvA [Acholeplasmataceae bacterium]|nr:Holliday junction branch migration protein RuvA [Acholeplasmataceae bacterium]